MKFVKLILLLALLVPASAYAGFDTRMECQNPNEVANTLTDVIFVRPVGFVGTVVGAALFVGLSPFTALANIAPPHGAFDKMGAILVGVPFSYTFERPVGDFCR